MLFCCLGSSQGITQRRGARRENGAAFPHTERAGYDEGMPEHLLDNFDVFYGELTPARATVYARLEGLENTDGLSLSGIVCGPRCFYSKTLPATFRLQDAGPCPSLLAKALVPDPCYWSPETPNIYDVTVELRRGQDVIASEVRQIGFKPLGVSGRFFTWEGKPWVLRGVSNTTVDASELGDWTDRSTSLLFFTPPQDEQLEEASLRGILTWILLPMMVDTDTLIAFVREWAEFPAVAGVLLLPEEPDDRVPRSLLDAAPNVFTGIGFGNPTRVPAALRHRTFRQVKLEYGMPLHPVLAKGDYPLIVFREAMTSRGNESPPLISLERARATADRLQAELAHLGQFAGYIV